MGKGGKKFLRFELDPATYGEFWEVVQLLGEEKKVEALKRMLAIIKEVCYERGYHLG